jgi:hypothetical protein
MAERFTEFVLSLAEEPDKLAELIKDPNAFLKDVDLTAAEKALIKSGNPDLIRAAITEDLSKEKDNFPEILVAGGSNYRVIVFSITVTFPFIPTNPI